MTVEQIKAFLKIQPGDRCMKFDSKEAENAYLQELGIDPALEGQHCPDTGRVFSILGRQFPITVFPTTDEGLEEVSWYTWSTELELDEDMLQEMFGELVAEEIEIPENSDVFEMTFTAEDRETIAPMTLEMIDFMRSEPKICIEWVFTMGRGCTLDEFYIVTNKADGTRFSRHLNEHMTDFVENWLEQYGWEYSPM